MEYGATHVAEQYECTYNAAGWLYTRGNPLTDAGARMVVQSMQRCLRPSAVPMTVPKGFTTKKKGF